MEAHFFAFSERDLYPSSDGTWMLFPSLLTAEDIVILVAVEGRAGLVGKLAVAVQRGLGILGMEHL